MQHRLMLIEPSAAFASESLALLLGADFSVDRTNWDVLFPENVRRSSAHMVVAVAAGQRTKPGPLDAVVRGTGHAAVSLSCEHRYQTCREIKDDIVAGGDATYAGILPPRARRADA